MSLRHLWCAFCGRNERECTLLVEAIEAAICGDCIAETAGLAARHSVRDKPGPVSLERYRRQASAAASYRAGDDPGDAA